MKMVFYNKKLKIASVILIGAMLFTGCAEDALPEMTDVQRKSIGEFAAITLLKYDANSRSRLVDRQFIMGLNDDWQQKEEEEQNGSVEYDENGNSDSSTGISKEEVQYSGIADFLGLPSSISITYTGMSFGESYLPPDVDSSYLSIDASAGKIFAILNFTLVNHSSEVQELNILALNPIFRVSMNEKINKTALPTMLDSDLSTYMGNLDPGASENVVLLIEIDKGTENSIESANLTVKYGDDSYTMNLK